MRYVLLVVALIVLLLLVTNPVEASNPGSYSQGSRNFIAEPSIDCMDSSENNFRYRIFMCSSSYGHVCYIAIRSDSIGIDCLEE